MEPKNQLDLHVRIPLSLPSLNLRSWLPTRGTVVFTLLVLALFFLFQNALAFPWAAPAPSTSSWPYQGRLADSAGNPLTGVYPMIFRLYSANSGGVYLWEEQWTGPNSVQVSDGLFNVMLGSLNQIPQSVVSNNTSLWLGITVGADNEMTPRVQLGSVPFAAQALTVPNGSITNTKLADGAVTMSKLGADVSLAPPDGSITTFKLADGSVTTSKLAGLSVGGNQLADGAVTNSKLANGSVTDAKANLSYVYPNGDSVIINGKLFINHNDLVFMNSPRGDGGAALVLDWNDTLKLNYDGQFAGGVVARNFRTGGIVEENLQTVQEQNSDAIDRFSKGDVLCWNADLNKLEKCAIADSLLVVAVADENGRPLILGAEPVLVVGPVNPGDLLVSSDVPGAARAWTGEGNPAAGLVIAKALEACTSETCLIKSMILAR